MTQILSRYKYIRILT